MIQIIQSRLYNYDISELIVQKEEYMDLASAYNKINKPPVNQKQPRTSLEVKSNSEIISLFQQAVALIEPNRWIKASPVELKKEDYYFYLKFVDIHDIAPSKNKANRKNKLPVFSVEKIVTGNDVFQYKNQKGELDMYIRPQTSQRISGFDCSDCFDDKKAFNRFKEYLPNERWVMRNLYGQQEHVFLTFAVSDRDYSRVYTVVLFMDGNAYCFKETNNGSEIFDPYLEVIDLDLELCKANEDSLVNKLARSISQYNKWGYEGRVKPPVDTRISGSIGNERGCYIDYFVYNEKSYPAVYVPDKNIRQDRIRQRQCTYCGGPWFTMSRLGDKCPICGKKKDY